jgi:hypothetical protein
MYIQVLKDIDKYFIRENADGVLRPWFDEFVGSFRGEEFAYGRGRIRLQRGRP